MRPLLREPKPKRVRMLWLGRAFNRYNQQASYACSGDSWVGPRDFTSSDAAGKPRRWFDESYHLITTGVDGRVRFR